MTTGHYEMVDQADDCPVKFEVEKKFKDYFDQNAENGVVLVNDLLVSVANHEVNTSLSYHQVMQVLQTEGKLLKDSITYQEFHSMMLKNSGNFENKIELTCFQRMVEVAAGTVIPSTVQKDKHKVQWYVWEYRCGLRQIPWFMILLSLLQIAVFIGHAVDLSKSGLGVSVIRGFPRDTPLTWITERRHEAWRFLTYVTGHQGWLPLLITVILQLTLGVQLEVVHRWWRVLLVYLAGTLAGSLLTSILQVSTSRPSRLAGGGAGVYALVAAHLMAVIMNWHHMRHNFRNVWVNRLCSVPARVVYLVFAAVLDVSISVVQTVTEDDGIRNSVAGHFGGVMAGILLGVPFFQNPDIKPYRSRGCIIGGVLYLALIIFAVFWNIFYPGYVETNRSPCC